MTSPALHFSILTTEAEIEAIAPDWQNLHHSAGKSFFGGYDAFRIWWRHWQDDKTQLHLIAAHDGQGALRVVWPLTVRRKKAVRLAQWAGGEVFDYSDILAASPAEAQAAVAYAAAHGRYDCVLLKEVTPSTTACSALTGAMRLRAQRHNYFLTLDFASGAAWLAAQSRKLRGDARRKKDKMQTQGAVATHVLPAGASVPAAVMTALYTQKMAWFRERHSEGAFAHPAMPDFLNDFAAYAARQGLLYLSWITCGEAIVACHMGFVHDDVLHLYLTTYDAAYGAYSPGNLLMIDTIGWAIDAGCRELDFMRGDEAYKQRFASSSRPLSDFIAGRGLIGRVAVWLRGLWPVAVNATARDQTDQ